MVSFEVLAGIGWTVVIFAAIVAYLEPRFSKIWLEEQNKTVARKLIDTILDENVATLPNELFASKCSFYDYRNPGGIHDLNTIMDSVDWIRHSIAGGEITVSDQIAKGDYVTIHWTASGVERGSYRHSRSLMFMGLPGQSQDVSGTHLIRLAQGKATEVWFLFRSG
jgi:hypothetical protein